MSQAVPYARFLPKAQAAPVVLVDPGRLVPLLLLEVLKALGYLGSHAILSPQSRPSSPAALLAPACLAPPDGPWHLVNPARLLVHQALWHPCGPSSLWSLVHRGLLLDLLVRGFQENPPLLVSRGAPSTP